MQRTKQYQKQRPIILYTKPNRKHENRNGNLIIIKPLSDRKNLKKIILHNIKELGPLSISTLVTLIDSSKDNVSAVLSELFEEKKVLKRSDRKWTIYQELISNEVKYKKIKKENVKLSKSNVKRDSKQILNKNIPPQELFDGINKSILWYQNSLAICKRFKSKTHNQAGAHHKVYLILLEGVEDELGYALYVGLTGLTPEQRFQRHKDGIQASKIVKSNGTRLLPELYEHLNPMQYEEALKLESIIAESLKRVGIPTYGGH